MLPRLGLQHALERCLDVLDRCVDDVVETNLHTLFVCELRDLAFGSHVKTDDNCIRCSSQRDVALVDRADATVQYTQDDLVGHRHLDQCIFKRFDRAGHVALDDGLHLALFDGCQEILEGALDASLRQMRVALASWHEPVRSDERCDLRSRRGRSRPRRARK